MRLRRNYARYRKMYQNANKRDKKEISQKNKRTPALPMQPIIITCTTRQVGFLSQAAALPTSAFDSREACACQGRFSESRLHNVGLKQAAVKHCRGS